jgi:hypothetical protein
MQLEFVLVVPQVTLSHQVLVHLVQQVVLHVLQQQHAQLVLLGIYYQELHALQVVLLDVRLVQVQHHVQFVYQDII